MYRQYENPWELEEELARLEYELTIAEYEGASDDELIDIQMAIYEMKDRINFAWQDDEYDSMCADYDDELWMYENSVVFDSNMEWTEDVQIAYEESEIVRNYGMV